MADNILRNIKKQNKKKVLVAVKERMAKAVPAKGEYTEAVGRRKTAVARVRLYAAKKNEILINGISAEEYFKAPDFVRTAGESLGIEENKEKYSVSAFVKGGGISAQAEAVRLGVARCLAEINPELRPSLKAKGFMKRDPRAVERKKFGLLKARKAPTWVKR